MTEAELIRAARRALGHDQDRMGQALGVTKTRVYRWEAGKADVPHGVWDDLDGLLDARAAEIDRIRSWVREAREREEDEQRADR